MQHYPIIYIRGYAGATVGVDAQVDDPFYGFNEGATHIRVNGDGHPRFYQFEGPMLRLLIDEDYQLLVRGDQSAYLQRAQDGTVASNSIWVYRFYDRAATTFATPPRQNILRKILSTIRRQVTVDGFDIEDAALGLYDLITLVRLKTNADKVILVAHSMGGLVARCMMQKICRERETRKHTGRTGPRIEARNLVDKFFTYGTPHGGIVFDAGPINWFEDAVGPAGSDVFAPAKMYGYLTPGVKFGAKPKKSFDPKDLADSLDTDNVFCLIGTNAKDYGIARSIVGPRSDGLVRIDNAYIRKAHRAFVYRSHSGRYGEVNSEEGYQSLRRFLFGRWGIRIGLEGLPRVPVDNGTGDRVAWQADMRLTIRGLPVMLTEQRADHYCPIQLDQEMTKLQDSPDHPVPLVGTFLMDPVALARENDTQVAHGGLARYSLTLRVAKLVEKDHLFDFRNHLEQVFDWADTLIVDVKSDATGNGLAAYAAWSSEVGGELDRFDPIARGLDNAARRDRQASTPRDGAGTWKFTIPLPDKGRQLPIFGETAHLIVDVTDREFGPIPV